MDDLDVVAHAATLLAEPLRLRLLGELEHGEFTVSALAARLHVAQPRVSAQLAVLRKAGWVVVEPHGRQHYYRLASPHIVVAILELAALPPPPIDTPVVPTDDSNNAEPILRFARCCYDHLAGAVGVRMHDHFLQQGWLVAASDGVGKYQPAYQLTERGTQALEERGVTSFVSLKSRRRFAYACPDWTEANPHLGGVLAANLFQHLQHIGLVERQLGSRALVVNDDLEQWLKG